MPEGGHPGEGPMGGSKEVGPVQENGGEEGGGERVDQVRGDTTVWGGEEFDGSERGLSHG